MSALARPTAVYRLVPLLVLAACHVVPPPPVVPVHAGAAPAPEGSTTVMLVVGFAEQFLFGGGGLGLAVRVEQQQTDHTALGLELSGGKGSKDQYEDRSQFTHWLVGVRGYGTYAPSAEGTFALLSGAGLSLTATGLVTATVNAGAMVAYDNSDAIPLASLGLALAVPLARGRAFGPVPMHLAIGPPEPGMNRPLGALGQPTDGAEFKRPKAELYLIGGVGVVVPFGDTGHRMSLEATVGKALREGSGLIGLTLGDAQRFE